MKSYKLIHYKLLFFKSFLETLIRGSINNNDLNKLDKLEKSLGIFELPATGAKDNYNSISAFCCGILLVFLGVLFHFGFSIGFTVSGILLLVYAVLNKGR
jgi:hypothetical protein